MKKVSEELKNETLKLVKAAVKGDAPWFDEIVKQSGYINPQKVKGETLAELFGISPMAVSQWYKRDKLSRNPDKTYDLKSVLQWREEKHKNNLPSNSDIHEAERQLKWEKAKLARMEREKREGNLVNIDEVRGMLSEFAMRLRKAIDGVAKSHGVKIQGAIINAIGEIEKKIK
jgi:phage terminase Nu1 subunit (DNA packaging protein)